MTIFYQNTVGFFCVLIGFVYAQQFLDDECTLRSSGAPGVCQTFKDCPRVREDLRKFNQRPQHCGFYGSQPLVCCPIEKTRQPGEISRKMCAQYAEYVKETIIPPIGIIDAAPVTRNECGHKVVPLVVGGEEAGRREFPHMAAIGYGSSLDDAKWLCGGTILSDKYILTAAHCLSNHEWYDAKWVKIGVTKLNSTFRRQHFEIAELIRHPKYKSSSHYNDIGLIKLKKSARLNSYARPACLYLNEEISTRRAVATGWGQTAQEGDLSNDLLKVIIDFIDHDTCDSKYRKVRKLKKGILDDRQVCAGSEGKDTCQGDSGGPLQIYHTGDNIKCMYDIVAVTSLGAGCGGEPAVYTRVSYYVQWIEDIVWP